MRLDLLWPGRLINGSDGGQEAEEEEETNFKMFERRLWRRILSCRPDDDSENSRSHSIQPQVARRRWSAPRDLAK